MRIRVILVQLLLRQVRRLIRLVRLMLVVSQQPQRQLKVMLRQPRLKMISGQQLLPVRLHHRLVQVLIQSHNQQPVRPGQNSFPDCYVNGCPC